MDNKNSVDKKRGLVDKAVWKKKEEKENITSGSTPTAAANAALCVNRTVRLINKWNFLE